MQPTTHEELRMLQGFIIATVVSLPASCAGAAGTAWVPQGASSLEGQEGAAHPAHPAGGVLGCSCHQQHPLPTHQTLQCPVVALQAAPCRQHCGVEHPAAAAGLGVHRAAAAGAAAASPGTLPQPAPGTPGAAPCGGAPPWGVAAPPCAPCETPEVGRAASWEEAPCSCVARAPPACGWACSGCCLGVRARPHAPDHGSHAHHDPPCGQAAAVRAELSAVADAHAHTSNRSGC